jgi:hypothetical protein
VNAAQVPGSSTLAIWHFNVGNVGNLGNLGHDA